MRSGENLALLKFLKISTIEGTKVSLFKYKNDYYLDKNKFNKVYDLFLWKTGKEIPIEIINSELKSLSDEDIKHCYCNKYYGFLKTVKDLDILRQLSNFVITEDIIKEFSEEIKNNRSVYRTINLDWSNIKPSYIKSLNRIIREITPCLYKGFIYAEVY